MPRRRTGAATAPGEPSRVLWHPDAQPKKKAVELTSLVPLLAKKKAEEAAALVRLTSPTKQAKPKEPKGSKGSKEPKEPEPEPELSEAELEIVAKFEAKASWRTATWRRSSLDERLEAAKRTEMGRVSRNAAAAAAAAVSRRHGGFDAPPGKTPLAKQFYSALEGTVRLPEPEEKPVEVVDMTLKGLPHHSEQLHAQRDTEDVRERTRKRLANRPAAGPGRWQQPPPSASTPMRATAPAAVFREAVQGPGSPRSPARERRPAPQLSPVSKSPTRSPKASPHTPQTPAGKAKGKAEGAQSPERSAAPSPVSAKQRWAGARSKLKAASGGPLRPLTLTPKDSLCSLSARVLVEWPNLGQEGSLATPLVP